MALANTTKQDEATAALQAIAANTDGLEGFSDGVEPKLDIVHTDLVQLHTDAGTVGTAPPALPTGATGIIGHLRKMVEQLAGTVNVDIQDTSVEVSNDVGNPVPVSGTVTVSNPSGTATTTTTPGRASLTIAGTTSVLLFTTNTNRRGLLVNNRTVTGVYLKYGTAALPNSYDVWIPSGGYWEMPQPIFTGIVHIAFATSSGAGTLDSSEVLA